MKFNCFLLILFLSLFFTFAYAQDATYKIEFISNWSSTTHPDDYPISTAHWSPLIGTTHKNAAPFFQFGILASDGVEQVAETGGTSLITQEITIVIATGNAYEVINGSGLSSGLGTITVNNVNVDVDFPYISLITMIAPSPDWVAQVSNLKLTDAGNNWLSTISMDVYATDAGTDSGTTYASVDADTNPADNISSLENTFPFSDQIVGTFVFTLESVLSVNENSLENTISISPNPSEGTIFIHNSGDSVLKTAEIFAITGKKVKVFTNIANKKSLVFNSLQSGLYFVKLTSDKSSITKKLIIK